MAGTVFVALSDREDDDADQAHRLSGDLLGLASAVLYSIYTVTIRVQIPKDEEVAMPLVFGYIGLFSSTLLLPAVVALAVFAPATFDGFNLKIFAFITVTGFANNVFADYLWARAVVLTSPTVATVGLSLTIPLAFLSDWGFHNQVPTVFATVGAVAVISGFVLVSVVGSADKPQPS
mmetsp:Transcript_25982/g.35749  ORF Transcript_25982/g.35749 Transcript_25982/m.35749 type:complete len:177 (-) Transcript_25982:399-929(-)